MTYFLDLIRSLLHEAATSSAFGDCNPELDDRTWEALAEILDVDADVWGGPDSALRPWCAATISEADDAAHLAWGLRHLELVRQLHEDAFTGSLWSVETTDWLDTARATRERDTNLAAQSRFARQWATYHYARYVFRRACEIVDQLPAARSLWESGAMSLADAYETAADLDQLAQLTAA